VEGFATKQQDVLVRLIEGRITRKKVGRGGGRAKIVINLGPATERV